jgi:hypothetical protein
VRTSTSRSIPPFAEASRGHRPDPPQRIDRQLLKELLHPLRRNHREAVGLSPRRGDLRKELVRRDAGGCGQRGGVPDLRLEPPRDFLAERLAPRVLGDVEIGLVQRQRLDHRRHRAEDLEHRLRHRPVLREIGPDDDEIGAEAHRARHRNGGPYAELARFVARRGDDTASLWTAADGDRFPAQRGPIPLLDRRVERVHVHVKDPSQHRAARF